MTGNVIAGIFSLLGIAATSVIASGFGPRRRLSLLKLELDALKEIPDSLSAKIAFQETVNQTVREYSAFRHPSVRQRANLNRWRLAATVTLIAGVGLMLGYGISFFNGDLSASKTGWLMFAGGMVMLVSSGFATSRFQRIVERSAADRKDSDEPAAPAP